MMMDCSCSFDAHVCHPVCTDRTSVLYCTRISYQVGSTSLSKSLSRECVRPRLRTTVSEPGGAQPASRRAVQRLCVSVCPCGSSDPCAIYEL